MRLTRDRFRLKCALAFGLVGIAMLALADWKYLRATYVTPPASVDWWMHGSYHSKRDPKATPVGIAMLMLFAAGCVCFEFKGDPAPKKDPWEGGAK